MQRRLDDGTKFGAAGNFLISQLDQVAELIPTFIRPTNSKEGNIESIATISLPCCPGVSLESGSRYTPLVTNLNTGF